MEYYNKIFSQLKYRASKCFINDDDVFMTRLKKLQADDSDYKTYDDDIKLIKEKYSSYEEFETECAEVKSKLYDIMEAYRVSIRSEYNNYADATIDADYKVCTLKTNHKYLSVDIHYAGIQSLIYLGIIKDYKNWDEIITKCTSNSLILNSKAFRVNFFNEMENKYGVKFHQFIIPMINKLLKNDLIQNNFKDVIPNLFLGDEIMFDITDRYNDFDDVLGDQTIDDIYLNISKLEYYEIGFLSQNELLSVFPIRKFEDRVYMPYKGVKTFWLMYDVYHNIEPDDSDYLVQVTKTVLGKCQLDISTCITGDELEECKSKYRIVM